MQRGVRYTFCSRELWLLYNGAAMFEISEIVGGTDKLSDVLLDTTPESIGKMYDVFLSLARNGMAAMKYLGYPVNSDDIPERDAIMALTTVDDIARMRESIIHAISAGVGREVSDSENAEIDLGLEELKQQKKKTG